MTTISENDILGNAKAGAVSHTHARASHAPTVGEFKVVGQMAEVFIRPRNTVRGL